MRLLFSLLAVIFLVLAGALGFTYTEAQSVAFAAPSDFAVLADVVMLMPRLILASACAVGFLVCVAGAAVLAALEKGSSVQPSRRSAKSPPAVSEG